MHGTQTMADGRRHSRGRDFDLLPGAIISEGLSLTRVSEVCEVKATARQRAVISGARIRPAWS